MTTPTTAPAQGRTTAWQRLGTSFDGQDANTAEQVLGTAGLTGWNVCKMPAYSTYIDEDGAQTEEIPDTFGVWRTNPQTGKRELMVNGTVGSVWNPYQNEEMVDFLDALSGHSGAAFSAAGNIHGGRDVFVSMRLPDAMLVGGVDPVDLYLSAFNNHAGRGSLTLTIGGIRVWCANQQNVVTRHAKSTFKVRHTTNMRDGAVAEARRALELSFKYVSELQEEADRMIDASYSDAEFEAFIAELCGERPEAGDVSPRQLTAWEDEVGQLRYLFREAETQAPIRNTRWGAYQAFTEYLDWYSPVQSKKLDAAQVRAVRTLGNDYAAMKQSAYELLAVG